MAYQPSALAAFFVFNPELGDEATEGEKILYFSPSTCSLDQQKTYVGLVEGLVNFSKDFSHGKPCRALRCERHRYSFLECEPDYWITLVVRNPTSAPPKSSNPKDRTPLERELDDSVMFAIIKHSYTTFRFFNGTMKALHEKHGVGALRTQIKSFLDYYIPTIKFSQLRFFTDINGFRFFPVDKTTYLAIQYLSYLITTQFPRLRNMSAMYSSRLIWSGLDQDDMRIVYNLDQNNMNKGLYVYLATSQLEDMNLGGDHPSESSSRHSSSGGGSGSSSGRRRRTEGSSSSGSSRSSRKRDPKSKSGDRPHKSRGAFQTGPLRRGPHSSNCPRVHFASGAPSARLLVYRYHKLTLSWIMDEADDIQPPSRSSPTSSRMPPVVDGKLDPFAAVSPSASTNSPSSSPSMSARSSPSPGSTLSRTQTSSSRTQDLSQSAGNISVHGSLASSEEVELKVADSAAATAAGAADSTSSQSSAAPPQLNNPEVSSEDSPEQLHLQSQDSTSSQRSVSDSVPTRAEDIDSPPVSACVSTRTSIDSQSVSSSEPPKDASATAKAGQTSSSSTGPSAFASSTSQSDKNGSSSARRAKNGHKSGPSSGANEAPKVAPTSNSSSSSSSSESVKQNPEADSPPSSRSVSAADPDDLKLKAAGAASRRSSSKTSKRASSSTNTRAARAPAPVVAITPEIDLSQAVQIDPSGADASSPTAASSSPRKGSSSYVPPPPAGSPPPRPPSVRSLKEQSRSTRALCSALEEFMLPKIRKLCLTLETQSKRLKEQEEPFRFLYFNQYNLALKTSLNSRGPPLSPETVQTLRRIHVDFGRPGSTAREVSVKMAQDGWIVGRKCAETKREYYVLIDEKTAPTLHDLKPQIDALESTYFSNIFVL